MTDLTRDEFNKLAECLDYAVKTSKEAICKTMALEASQNALNKGKSSEVTAQKVKVDYRNIENEIENNHYLPNSELDDQKKKHFETFANKLKTLWKEVGYKPDKTDPKMKAFLNEFKTNKGMMHQFATAASTVQSGATEVKKSIKRTGNNIIRNK